MTIENLNDEETLALLSYYVKIKDLAKALELCQERPYELISISFIHAAILCQIGLYERAIVLYCKVLEVEPNNDLCKFQLGVAQFFSNQNHEAFETWHGLDDFVDFVDFVEAFRSLSEQNLSDAEHRLEAFIAKNKKYPELNADAENLLVQIRINVDDESTESEVVNNSVVSNEVESLLSIYKQ